MSETDRQPTISLSSAAQTRNMLIFGLNTALIYLSAPVLYVGVMQANLCEALYGSKIDVLANLPKTTYLAATVFPVFVAWYLPYVRALKWIISAGFWFNAVAIGLVAWLLPQTSIEPGVKILAVILQGTLSGCALTVAVAFMWEVLGRGVSESRRGLALSLGFGFGPFLAFFGSLASQVILNGSLDVPFGTWTWHLSGKFIGIPPGGDVMPRNYALLFRWIAPCMGVAGLASMLFVIPLPERELQRERFRDVVLGGISTFLKSRVLMWAALFTVLAYSENLMDSNLGLYTKYAVQTSGVESAEVGSRDPYTGVSLALRFFVKGVVGLLLGWGLTRSSPRMGLLVTSSLYLAALVYGILVTGPWYLLVFGLYGAGELVGVYAPNYVLAASPPDQMRKNMAFTTMLMAPISLVGPVFGVVSQSLGEMTNVAMGYRLSFALCALFQLVGLSIAWYKLPPSPSRNSQN